MPFAAPRATHDDHAIHYTTWRIRMFLQRFVALTVSVLFFAIGTVVVADAPTLSIQQRAELIPSVGIFVHVVVDCGDGETDGTIEVAARQGNITGSNIDTVTNAEN